MTPRKSELKIFDFSRNIFLTYFRSTLLLTISDVSSRDCGQSLYTIHVIDKRDRHVQKKAHRCGFPAQTE